MSDSYLKEDLLDFITLQLLEAPVRLHAPCTNMSEVEGCHTPTGSSASGTASVVCTE